MVLATPFFRHLARPREAEKTEREKVRRNSVSPSVKVPSVARIFLRLCYFDSSLPGASTAMLSSQYQAV